jgi:type III secretory pathway component EscS
MMTGPPRAMSTSSPATRYDRSLAGRIGVGTVGCLLALILGTATATNHGQLVLDALVGLAFCGVAIVIYARDPVLALIWLWIFEVFNAPLSAMVGYGSSAGAAVRQGDEVLVLLFVLLTVWRAVRTDARMPPARFVLPGIAVAVFGLLGAAVHGVPITVAFAGAWLGLKLWVMIAVTLMLPWEQDDIRRIYSVFTGIGLLVAALGVLDYLTHAAISQALHTSIVRFSSEGFRGEAVHSIFPNPGEYSVFMSMLFALTFSRFAEKRSKSDLVMALVFAGSVMLSLRLKGVLSLAAVAIVVVLVQAATQKRGAVTALLIGMLLVVGIYSVEGNVISQRVSTFASSETTARARLYTTGEHIATDDFPLGVGFGRYASYMSRLDYSPIYYQYGLSSIYGLSQARPDYIDDTSWPSVIGETGFGGLAIYLAGLVVVVLAIVKSLRAARGETRWVPLAALCAMAALLVDSLGDPTLFDWVPITTLALILGPALIAGRIPGQPEMVYNARVLDESQQGSVVNLKGYADAAG